MSTINKIPYGAVQHTALAVLAAALALMGLDARAQQAATPPDSSSVASEADVVHEEVVVSKPRWRDGIDALSVQFDNDLFAGGGRDRDYTGGMGITMSGMAARDSFLSLDPLLAKVDGQLDQLTEPAENASVHYARQTGLMAFTPSDTLIAAPQPNDRPYASLLFMSNGRVRVDADDRGAWTSSLTVGVLGLSLSERLHSTVHELVGSERPRGYDHQISTGGEPTARYTLARQQLWIAHPSGALDVKTSVQGSVGFLTEASAALSLRIGRFDSPWWSFAPELTDYMAAPVPTASLGVRRELYAFAGVRAKARAYNAFLQGQFRDSEVSYSADEIEPVLVEAWLGVVTEIFEDTQLSYTVRYQSAELRHGDAARNAIWGTVQLAHSF